ncbi:MAG: PorT family protein [Chitinispirillales bacterium]|jgi:hypothetical protein|nr:PorT family protein [Chitinispirillales bacterium]
MYKIKRVAALLTVVLVGAIAPVNASDDGLRFGVRIGSNMNMYYSENLSMFFNVDMDMGYGFDAELAAKYPLTNRLSLNSEVSFCYRVLGSYKTKGESSYYDEDESGDLFFVDYINYDIKASFREMAVLVPVMIQFTTAQSAPFYVSAGVQLGFPFNNRFKGSEKNYTSEGEILSEYSEDGSDDDYRSLADFGLAFGIGCMAMSNLGVDLRFVINLNGVYDKRYYDKTSLMYFTFGISYFL